MSRLKGWPIFSLVIGSVTLVVIWLAYHVVTSIELWMEGLQSFAPFQSPGPNPPSLDTIVLFIQLLILSMLLCGALAALISRQAGVSLRNGLHPSLLAASVPILFIDLFILVSFINNTHDYYSTQRGTQPLYPTEPPFLPVYLLIMAIFTLTAIISAVVGVIIARWALNSRKKILQ